MFWFVSTDLSAIRKPSGYYLSSIMISPASRVKTGESVLSKTSEHIFFPKTLVNDIDDDASS